MINFLMIDITRRSFFKYWLFGSLYFSEGLLKAIAVVIFPIYLIGKDISPELITLIVGIGALPVIIKFLWGGIVDYFIRFGRKIFIIIGGLFSIIGTFLVSFIDPSVNLIAFTLLMFICWMGVMFLDVSADAWAIEISCEKERGKINGAMYAGQNIGLASGAALLPFIAQNISYPAVFTIASVIVLLIIIFPLFIKENKIKKIRKKFGKILISEFKKKIVILIAIFAVLLKLSEGLILIVAPIFMNINLQLDITQVGLITMIFMIAMAFGSLTGGTLADKWGRKKSLYLFIFVSIIFSASLIFSNNWQNFTFLYSILGFLQGGYTSVFLAMCMDVTNPQIGATQFSIFTSLSNFGTLGLEFISGTLFVMLGFTRLFLYSAWIFGPALLVLYIIRLKPINNNSKG